MKHLYFWTNHSLKIYFIGIFLCLFFFMGYNKLISTGPCSTHTWRQSDSYSFALTYYYEGNSFFEPSILFIGEDGHGKAISEFPILYFITAKIWKVTGPSPGVLRFLNFSILLVGLFHLLLLSFEFLKDWFWAFFVILLLFSSPLLGFFSFNFIPNIPAFGLALTGLYYLHLFLKTKKNVFLLISTTCYTLAALIKITSMFSLLAILFVLGITHLKKVKNNKPIFLRLLLSFILIMGIYLCWYKFSVNYNHQHLRGIFNQSIIPIWDLKQSEIAEILDKAYQNILPQFFNPIALVVLLILFIFLTIYPKVDKWLIYFSGVLFIGVISFIVLFFQGLNVHDYFLIDMLIFIPAVMTTFLGVLLKQHPGKMKSIYTKIAGILIVGLLINNCMIITRSHYNPNDPLVKYNIPLPKYQQNYWDYNYFMLTQHDLQYQGIDNYLRKIGINYNDKVITLDDYSPNKTLCFMQLRGFSDYHYSWNYNENEKMKRMIELGASYLVVCGNDHLTKESLAPYIQHLYGKHNNVYIYKLEPSKLIETQLK